MHFTADLSGLARTWDGRSICCSLCCYPTCIFCKSRADSTIIYIKNYFSTHATRRIPAAAADSGASRSTRLSGNLQLKGRRLRPALHLSVVANKPALCLPHPGTHRLLVALCLSSASSPAAFKMVLAVPQLRCAHCKRVTNCAPRWVPAHRPRFCRPECAWAALFAAEHAAPQPLKSAHRRRSRHRRVGFARPPTVPRPPRSAE